MREKKKKPTREFFKIFLCMIKNIAMHFPCVIQRGVTRHSWPLFTSSSSFEPRTPTSTSAFKSATAASGALKKLFGDKYFSEKVKGCLPTKLPKVMFPWG
jgi:hypothetical protein